MTLWGQKTYTACFLLTSFPARVEQGSRGLLCWPASALFWTIPAQMSRDQGLRTALGSGVRMARGQWSLTDSFD